MGMRKANREVYQSEEEDEEEKGMRVQCQRPSEYRVSFPCALCLGDHISGWDSHHHRLHSRGLHYARL